MPVMYDRYHDKTLHITAGGDEFIYVDLFKADSSGITPKPLLLGEAAEIEFRLAPYSVIESKKHSLLTLYHSGGEITIVPDSYGGATNRIQIKLPAAKTQHLSGGFVYQVMITDRAGQSFIPLQGILVISELIQTKEGA